MRWEQQDNVLQSRTEFGTYEITVDTKRSDDKIRVKLNAFKRGVEFEGFHGSIGQATEAAETDYNYRTHMWEMR